MKMDDEFTVDGAKLLQVYLDGFMSGCCSLLLTFTDMNQGSVVHIAQTITDGMTADEEGKAMLINEIQERLDNRDTGPKHSEIAIAIDGIPAGNIFSFDPEMN
jgi:hypothetical protein